MNSPVDQAFVALTGRYAVVKVEGRGTYKLGASLRTFGDDVVNLRLPLMLIDMAQCIGMDSTFMGVLAGIATRLKPHTGRVVLINCSHHNHNLLATLGLDQLIDAFEDGQAPEAYQRMLEGGQPDEKLETTCGKDAATVDVMLSAHQQLVDLVPENLPQFRDVLTYLREEASRKTGATGRPG